ncbi:GH92 family glycosyl hydrolase [Reichenbachiella sp. MALMAid0571]|uniref:GH92 family glycosyl hydrolase n=1 Tax=Reichenbachiella sp. MALMAid0571 TaxID=3143939 RepID=UPI0032DF04FE
MIRNISKSIFLILTFCCIGSCTSNTTKLIEKPPVDYIDPLIGSVAKTKYYGRTFPGATLPFSLVQLSPDTYTGGDMGSGYSYEHNTIEGFSFVHMSGIGWFGDFGNLLTIATNGSFHPNRGQVNKPETGYRSRFSHNSEIAQAGFYSVDLDDYHIKAEMTTTQRAGMLRFTFPEVKTNRIQIDLSRRIGGTSTKQYIKVIDNTHIEGWMLCESDGGGWGNGKPERLGYKIKYTVYFHAEFSKPFTSSAIWSADIPDEQPRKDEDVQSEAYQGIIAKSEILNNVKEHEGKHIGFTANFPHLKNNEQVLFKAGISFVDIQGAKQNLAEELNHWDFEKVKNDARNKWSQSLNLIKIKGGTEDDKKIFYTAMYHARIDPRCFTDVDGRYYGGDHQIHNKSNFNYRTIFSGWDAFRSHIPLLTIIDPNSTEELVNSLVEKGQLGKMGFPKWEIASSYSGCMLGDPAIPVIFDAYNKGIRGFDIETAYQLAKQTSIGPNTTRNSWQEYNELGYVACDPQPVRWKGYYKGVSATLENCYADWNISQFANALGKTNDEAFFSKRALYYKNIYDDSVGYMRGKFKNGDWIPWEGKLGFEQACIESNPLQQTWFVPHDIDGLKQLMGKERFLSELELLFDKTPKDFSWNEYYNHANEPVHHIPYLFNHTDKPWLTQKWVRTIMKNAYGTSPYGIMGNDDVGQMSAWYILSAMGFHPVCPGSNRYELGSPLFDEIKIKLDPKYYEGQTFKVTAKNNSPDNVYVQAISLNGKNLNRPYITHEEIVNGGELLFEMGSSPNKNLYQNL